MENGWKGLHILEEQKREEERVQALRDRYQVIAAHYPDVLEDILIDLGFNMDIDPRDIPSNTLRNYGFILLDKMGMKAVPQIKDI